MDKDGKSCSNACMWTNLIWWSKLLVAVIAVPMVGIVVGSLVPGGDFGKTIAFVITCWICVFAGMKLMGNMGSAKK